MKTDRNSNDRKQSNANLPPLEPTWVFNKRNIRSMHLEYKILKVHITLPQGKYKLLLVDI